MIHTIRTFSRSGVISISTVSKQPEGKTLSSQPLIKMKTDCFKSLFYSQDLFTIVAPYGFDASIPHGRKRFDFDWFSCRVQSDLFCVRSNWRVTKFVFKYTLLSWVSLQKNSSYLELVFWERNSSVGGQHLTQQHNISHHLWVMKFRLSGWVIRLRQYLCSAGLWLKGVKDSMEYLICVDVMVSSQN